MRVPWITSVVAVAALTLAACTGQDEPVVAPTPEPPPAPTSATSPSGSPEAPTASPPQRTGTDPVPEFTFVPWPDAPRELTHVEQQFMVEPGPFSGDDHDEDEAFAAVLTMDPRTPEEWHRAIQLQIQDDHVDDARAAIAFDAALGEMAPDPSAQDLEPDPEAPVGQNHFALLLDASGSMAAQSSSGTRMAEAKAALEDFVAEAPEGSTVSLRVYGHEGDNTEAGKAVSCLFSEVVFEGPIDADGFGASLERVTPTGWTPLGLAIEDAAGDIPDSSTDGIVYVVTDGIETCGGDPVRAAGDLASVGIQPIVNVIGFQVGDADQEALRAIADAGGGEYTSVESGAELSEYWRQEHSRMAQAWLEWRNSEIDRIVEVSRANTQEIVQMSTRMREGVLQEASRARDLTQRLFDEGVIDHETREHVWSALHERMEEMTEWISTMQESNWDANQDNLEADWAWINDKGTSNWQEHYRNR